MMRRLYAAPFALLLAAAVPAAAATTKTVTIQNIDFSVHTVRIHSGDSVTWRFRDAPSPHTVTSYGAHRFKSASARKSGNYTVRFTKTGTYRFHCTIHPNMQGKVVVS
jgi:plastocyanin